MYTPTLPNLNQAIPRSKFHNGVGAVVNASCHSVVNVELSAMQVWPQSECEQTAETTRKGTLQKYHLEEKYVMCSVQIIVFTSQGAEKVDQQLEHLPRHILHAIPSISP